jgi:hypothetical protein
VAVEEVEGFIADGGFETVAGFGSAQHECFDIRWCEQGDFDGARAANRVPHHDDRAVADSVERRNRPVGKVRTLLVQRGSDAVIDQRPQVVGEDGSVQRQRVQQKQLHVAIITDSRIRAVRTASRLLEQAESDHVGSNQQ